MSHIPTDVPATEHRPVRSWFMDALVVLGILAFGYFAVTLDNPPAELAQIDAPPSIQLN